MLNLSMAILMLLGGIYEDTPFTVSLDPNFDEMECYREWLETRPPVVAFESSTISGTDGAQFLLIFQEGLTDSLEDGYLNRWTADIQSQGLSTEVVEVTYSTVEELRSYLQTKYSQGMEGAVLVGDLPVPWSLLEDDSDLAGAIFPSDYYYMDLDGIWEDNWMGWPSSGVPGSDGFFDTISGNLDPEIYIARIKISNLTELGDPTDILNDYLDRNHSWRLTGDPEPLNALCYVDDDWEPWAYSYQAAMETLYPNTELVSSPSATNGTDYINNRLPGNYVWISPFVHSTPHLHSWSPGPSTTWDQIVPALPQAHFYNLFACSNSLFTANHCMGSVYALCSNAGLASVGSTKSGAMLDFVHFYAPMGDGASLGEAYREWWDHVAQGGLSAYERSWHLGMVVIGDPTLMPAMHMLGIEDQGSSFTPGVSLSSNPARLQLEVEFPAAGASVELYDISGRLAVRGTISESVCTLDLVGLSSGVYVVRVSDGTLSGYATVTVTQ